MWDGGDEGTDGVDDQDDVDHDDGRVGRDIEMAPVRATRAPMSDRGSLNRPSPGWQQPMMSLRGTTQSPQGAERSSLSSLETAGAGADTGSRPGRKGLDLAGPSKKARPMRGGRGGKGRGKGRGRTDGEGTGILPDKDLFAVSGRAERERERWHLLSGYRGLSAARISLTLRETGAIGITSL